jgi:AN1-type zinc finger protein 5/6
MCDSISNTKKIKKPRCQVCNKKVGLLGFTCACSDKLYFCSSHRLPENHNCKFDHAGHGKILLSNKLVKVDGDKVIKI